MSRTATRKNIEIDNDILKWLDDEYEGTSIWYLVNLLLREFMKLHKIRHRLPKFAKRAAKESLKEIRS